MTSAETGLVEDSVEVVLFRDAGNGAAVPVAGAKPVRLAGVPSEPLPELAALLDSAVELTPFDDLPAELIRAVAEQPVPPLFAASPWLHEHRALVFTDGRCALGDYLLGYGDGTGLYLDEQPESEMERSLSGQRAAAEGAQEAGLAVWTPFDLLAQPWIPVVDLDGGHRLIGLEQLIRQAHELRRIAAEAPTMTAALHRLLLALVHRVYGPASDEEWKELWSAGEFPVRPLKKYLDGYRDRFDLFHPARPFMQCAALAGLTPSSPGKLVPYRAVGNNVTLFDHTTSADQIVLSPAEAARWLVTVQSFDPGGMKTPYEKDKSSEQASCNRFGVVLIEGATVKETLLLNSLVYRPDDGQPTMTTPEDRPVWEEGTGPSPKPGKRVPRGWTDLLTWPSRRVLLFSSNVDGNTVVDGVVLTPGVRADVNLADEEKMVAFRAPWDGKGRPKLGVPMYPVRLRPIRGIWRHSVELLMVDNWVEGRTRQRPPALDQLDGLAEPCGLERAVYTLRVFGQQLDSKASVVEAWLEDEVQGPVVLMRSDDEQLSALVGAAIAFADDLGSALRALQRNFRRELSAEPVSTIDLPYWPRLSRPFNVFLVDLGAARSGNQPEAPVAERWGRQVEQVARIVADKWVAGSPAEAHKLMVLGKHLGQFHGHLTTAQNNFKREIASYAY